MSKLHRYNTFINESIVKRDKDTEVFNYKSIVNDAWRPIIKSAQEFQKINFDLENNDSLDDKRTLFVKKNLRKDQPVKYEINLELYMAGGDWEMPVMYFKAEITHHYGLISNKYQNSPEYVWDLKRNYSGLYHCFVLIPDNEHGNVLAKTDKGWTAHTDESASADGLDKKDFKITDDRKKKAWDWVISLFENAIDDRHEMLDDDDRPEPSPTELEPQPDTVQVESLKHIAGFELFEKRGMEPVKHLTHIVLQKEDNPGVTLTITVDNMNRITDVRSPGGIRHIFRKGNLLNKRQLENWMGTNGFVEKKRSTSKQQLKGNDLVKFMMKRGYR